MSKQTEALKLALEAQERAWLWMENQADGQSKGGHATFDLMMLREERDALRDSITAIREALAEQPAQQQEPVKLWLWKNFVKGRPEYWAFDNAFPVNMNNDDPQVIGEPCGYAWLKPSRQGRFDMSDEEVLRAVQNAKEYPPASKPLTDEEIKRRKPISADFVSFRAGVRCMEREYRIGEKR